MRTAVAAKVVELALVVLVELELVVLVMRHQTQND